MNYQDIKTFEDACNARGKDPNAIYSAHDKLEIIAKALRGDFKADYDNKEQRKHFPYFWKPEPSGSRFVYGYAGFDYEFADAASGPRLAQPDREHAIYFGTQFINEWNDYLTDDEQ